MADAELRQLERDAAREDDVAAAARLLRERVRQGTLDEDRLRLAAEVGHAAAAEALGARVSAEDPDLREWVWNFLPWGHRTVVRAVLAGVRLQLDLEPCEEGEELYDQLLGWCEGIGDDVSMDHLSGLLRDATARGAITLTSTGHPLMALGRLGLAVQILQWGGTDKDFLQQVALDLRFMDLPEDVFREAIREALVEWALREEAA